MLLPSLEPSQRGGSNEGSQDVFMEKYGKLSIYFLTNETEFVLFLVVLENIVLPMG